MTKQLFTSYVPALLLAFALVGVSFASASEVTGTLSSEATANSPTVGDISGTVSGGSNGGGSSSGSSGGATRGVGGGSADPSPDGAVLGVDTDAVSAPAFPNAGFAPAMKTSFPAVRTMSMIFTNIVTFITGR